MKNLTFYFATLGLSFLALSPARAALDPAIVGADAKWVVFVDVNELRDSALGKELIGIVQKHVQSELTKSPVQLDFTKTLASIGTVTAYGANFSSTANQTRRLSGHPRHPRFAKNRRSPRRSRPPSPRRSTSPR
jgi:hypothetical protein